MIDEERSDSQETQDAFEGVDLSVLNRRTSRERPDVSHMQDAVVPTGEGLKFILKPGDKVVIERVTSVLKEPRWLDTFTYTVVDVDQATGNLKLHNDDLSQQASSNFKTGLERGYKFKVPSRVPVGVVSKPPVESVKKGRVERVSDVTKTVVRRVYDVKGFIHTRVAGVIYAAPKGTIAKDCDRLTFEVNGPSCKVSDSTKSWSEVWERVEQ